MCWRLARLLCFVVAALAMVGAGLDLVIGASPRPRPELQFGTPSEDFIARAGYIQARATHYTPWVIEHLTAADFHQRATRDGLDFHPDEDQPAEARWTNRDYSASGYDRGHLAPADDNTHSAMAMRDSFCLTNTMPQTPELNRGPWRMLEEHVGRLAAGSGVEAWVVTGPAWLADVEGKIAFDTLGHHQIWIPTHCFKAVLVKQASGHFEAFAWLLPNNSKPPAFTECAASVDEIEAATGFDLFAGLPDEVEDKLEAAR